MDYEYSRETERSIKEKTTIKRTACDVDVIDKSDGPVQTEITDQHLHLMELYLSEWEHRDSSLWKQAFAYFIFSFAVTVFPFVSPWNLCEQLVPYLPKWIFPLVGMVLSVVFGFVIFGYVRRFRRTGEAYRNMIKNLPERYRIKFLRNHNSLKETPKGEKWDYILGKNMSAVITVTMFSVLFFFALLVLIVTLKNNL